VALVDEGVIRIHHGSVDASALPQSSDLAGDRMVGLWRKLGDDGLRRAAYRGG
jgi:hypothetical protein